MNLQVGIDPTGGNNPWSPNIIWSAPAESFDKFTQFVVEAVAQNNVVSVWTKSQAEHAAATRGCVRGRGEPECGARRCQAGQGRAQASHEVDARNYDDEGDYWLERDYLDGGDDADGGGDAGSGQTGYFDAHRH